MTPTNTPDLSGLKKADIDLLLDLGVRLGRGEVIGGTPYAVKCWQAIGRFEVLIAKVEGLEGKEEGSAGADLSPASRSQTPLSAGLRDIGAAPKDRTPILAKFRDDIYPGIRPGRDDLEPWNGRWVVIHHPGVTADGFDIGWSVSAPVGNGGFPDEWIEGWMPLPPAEIGPSGAQRSELAISAPDAPKSNSGADQ